MKSTTYIIKTLGAAAALLLGACNYLDVAPARKATLEDAMKDKMAVENWIYGCYSAVGGNVNYWGIPSDLRSYEGSTDEFAAPDLWNHHRRVVAYGNINSSNMSNARWRAYYGSIGNVHLFLRELENQNPSFLTEDDKNLYRSHAHFLKGYFYFRLLQMFGPIPLVDSYVSTSTPKKDFPGRSHFDFCVDYIYNELDQAQQGNLPGAPVVETDYGAGNKTICAALKSRLLLYAASPLWNGAFPSPNWRNTNFEPPGYGKELVSYTFDIKKWERAKTAAEEAIRVATENGFRLMQLDDAELLARRHEVPMTGCWLPGVDTNTPEGEEFARRVMLMRYVSASDPLDGNKELIMTLRYENSNKCTDENSISGMPRRIIKNGSNQWKGGYAGLCPTLQAVEGFYTVHGKLPIKDKEFTAYDNWLKSAGISGRPEIINLNVNREPRFYAWISYDGCDIGPKLNNGQPFRVNLRDPEKSGYNPSDAVADQCQTGYISNKWLSPRTTWTTSNQGQDNFFHPYIRMAELYLNLAECCAELYLANGDGAELQSAIDNLNIVRKRAGVPELTTGDITADMTIRDWVRAERRIELFLEGHRYYDLRRWVIADQYLAAGVREGLDSFVSRTNNPSIEEFNRRVKVDGDYRWDNKLYLMPVTQTELYANPQMVQAPGY